MIQIRDYQPSDETAWLDTVALAYMHSQFNDQISAERDLYDESDGYQTVVSLVATSAGRIVGVIDAGVFNDDRTAGDLYVQNQGRGSYVELLAVAPAAQGQGIGKALLQACCARLAAAGAAFVEIFTRSDPAANALYQHLGAREIAHSWRGLASPKAPAQPRRHWRLDADRQELVVTAPTGRVTAMPEQPQWYRFFTEEAMQDYDVTLSYQERTYFLALPTQDA